MTGISMPTSCEPGYTMSCLDYHLVKQELMWSPLVISLWDWVPKVMHHWLLSTYIHVLLLLLLIHICKLLYIKTCKKSANQTLQQAKRICWIVISPEVITSVGTHVIKWSSTALTQLPSLAINLHWPNWPSLQQVSTLSPPHQEELNLKHKLVGIPTQWTNSPYQPEKAFTNQATSSCNPQMGYAMPSPTQYQLH